MTPLTVTVDGRPYTFGRLDYRVYEEFVAWAGKQLPDPVADLLAVAARLPDGLRDRFVADRIDAACDRLRQRGTLTDPDFQAFAQTLPALKHLFWLLLRRAHPALTPDQAFEVVCQAQEEHGEAVFEPVFRAMRPPVAEEAVEAAYFRQPGADRAAGPEGV